MKIKSFWKLTFDPAGTPLVVLGFGDYVEGTLRFPMQRGMEVVTLTNSAAPYLRMTGNTQIVIALNIYTAAPTVSGVTDANIAAAITALDSLIAIDATGKKPLNIQLQGYTSYYWQFANAAISNHDPGAYLESLRAPLVKSYSITCTGLSKKSGTP
ncbi:MAG: hypothetical protein WCS43_16790 [Verrucomicrobiota bacterium]